jgi:hypothetical protein
MTGRRSRWSVRGAHHAFGHRVGFALEYVSGLTQPNVLRLAGRTRAIGAARLAEQQQRFGGRGLPADEQRNLISASDSAAGNRAIRCFDHVAEIARCGPALKGFHG